MDKKNINSSQEYIFSSYQDALQTSLWVLNSDLIESQVNGIISIPEITYVHIESKDGDVWSSGIKLYKHVVKQSVVLQHEYLGGKVIDIGTLTIQSDLVAVDQSYQRFLFKEHLEKLTVSLSHELKLHDAKIEVQCEDSLSVESYPSAYVQIFTNLITNSLKHGFDDWGGENGVYLSPLHRILKIWLLTIVTLGKAFQAK
ncbi:hypothetical protein [Vibrio penaeicida]|uniref:hypothetical protein n=1 Tax=Vibrio penaeicida TaxID=104609 RepID=UPI001CC3F05A|nr:hypothetical protein [Vibrio penaeicida]